MAKVYEFLTLTLENVNNKPNKGEREVEVRKEQ